MSFKSTRHVFGVLLLFTAMTGCVSSNDGSGLQSVLDEQKASSQSRSAPQVVAVNNHENSSMANGFAPATDPAVIQPRPLDGTVEKNGSDFAAPKPTIEYIKPRESKTFLINGLGSSVKSIGYGFTNLAKKIPGSLLYNYASPIESSTIIRRKVTRQIKTAYRRNPDIELNLIGISFGANIVTLIAADLDRAGIPVNYLVTMDGPAMMPVRKNVAILDNFTCSGLTCFKTKSKLQRGNRTTQYASFTIQTTHIPLANHNQVHTRILGQLRASRETRSQLANNE